MEVEYSSYSWCILSIIFMMAMINQAERFMISFVSQGSDMLDDTDTSQVEYGVLTGAAFLLVYGVATLPMGRFADTTKHPKLFLISMSILWNVSSACTALATSFGTLLWPRILFGIFSSALDPAALRLSARYFPTYRRGLSTGLFMSCLYIGAAISSICLVIAEAIGWRLTYVLVAIIGAVISLIVGPFIRSSAKLADAEATEQLTNESQKSSETRPLREDLKELVKNRTLIYITIIGFFRFSGTYARTFFEPEFFTRTYSDMKTVYSFCNAAIVILTCIGPIVGGNYTDQREADNPKLRPLVCCITTLSVVPLFFIMYLVDNFAVAIICDFFTFFIGETFISINFAMLMNVSTPRVAALQCALFLVTSFIGGSISTFILGLLDSNLEMLKYTLLIINVLAYGVSGIIFGLLIKIYPGDYRECQNSAKKVMISK